MTNTEGWRKSSYSGGQNNDCVELDVHATRTSIRDTKNRSGGTLTMPATTWARFLTAVKHNH